MEKIWEVMRNNNITAYTSNKKIGHMMPNIKDNLRLSIQGIQNTILKEAEVYVHQTKQ